MERTDDWELWESDSDDDNAGKEQECPENAAQFELDLVREGQSGGFHTRNKPGQKQRTVVTAYDMGRSKKKPAFRVGCEAKAIIHGTLDTTSEAPATLLVYDFHFLSYRSTRIKAADIWFEFRDKDGGFVGPVVEKVAPFSRQRIMPTTQKETRTLGLDSGVSGGAVVTLNGSVSVSRTVEKETTHTAEITGASPPDDFGNCFFTHWALKENDSQKNGIVSHLRTCILLTRANDDDDFHCIPKITAEPNFETWLGTICSSRTPDDPIIFDPGYEPYNALQSEIEIDPQNLGQVDLDSLWSYEW